jgi:hypothetical protein
MKQHFNVTGQFAALTKVAAVTAATSKSSAVSYSLRQGCNSVLELFPIRPSWIMHNSSRRDSNPHYSLLNQVEPHHHALARRARHWQTCTKPDSLGVDDTQATRYLQSLSLTVLSVLVHG